MEPGLRALQEEFRREQEAAMVRAVNRQARDRRNGTIAGAATGLFAVILTAGVTRRAFFWHSFLLESILGAVAGYLLARGQGGGLRGLLLFSGAFLLAYLLRALGLDPFVLFAAGDLRHVLAIQGNFMSLCIVASCGIGVGLAMND